MLGNPMLPDTFQADIKEDFQHSTYVTAGEKPVGALILIQKSACSLRPQAYCSCTMTAS